MPEPLSLRPALISDAAEIARLTAQLGYPSEPHTIQERLQRLSVRDEHFVCVAADGTQLLGWVAAEHRLPLEYGDKIEIVGLVVDANARRGGVGKALVATVETWARSRGQRELVVRSNIMRNESHPFYEHLGFMRSKTQHVYSRTL